jgi:hypothetical protein
MSSWGRVLIPVVLVLAVLIAPPPASTATLVSNTREVVRETVTWTLPADQCPDLPPGVAVTGTGNRFMQIFTKTFADGSSQQVINDVVQGTANGQTYTFVYRNTATLNIPANPSDPVHIQMADTFVLTGKGVKGIDIAFHWRWTYQPPAAPFDVFPLANLRADYTKGDPLACDPI